MNDSPETIPSRRKRIRWLGMTASMPYFIILDHQHEQQLSAADLWTFDDERTAFAQVGVGFEQDLIFFVELEIQRVTGVVLAPSIDVKSEVLAVCEPIFLTRLERLIRLAN